MIPDAAVEAAARASAAVFGEAPNKRDFEHIRLVLEAAAPHIEKDAYERGWGAGFRHTSAAMKFAANPRG